MSQSPDPRRREDPALHEQMVTAERSMFGTRLPRPTGVGRHLIVVAVVSAIALAIAIVLAERAPQGSDTGGAPPPGVVTP